MGSDDASELNRDALRAASGDRRAFARLYRGLHPVVARYVGRRIPGLGDAEDVVGQVFHRVVERIEQFDPKRGHVRAWVVVIARNAVIDHYRRRKAPLPLDQLVDGVGSDERGPLQELIDDEESARVRTALAACPGPAREVLSLRFGDGLRHEEIANVLGIGEAAARKRLSRALVKLRENIRALEAGKEVGLAV